MKVKVNDRVLTPEGTGFVEVVPDLMLADLPAGTENLIVRLDGVSSDSRFARISEITEVFEDSADLSTLRGQQAAAADLEVAEDLSETRFMTPFEQQVSDAQDLGFEKEVVLVSRPTKAPHLRVVMDLPEHEAALFFLPRTE